ncbi:hypothetical protein EI77_03252 [Prosthecobacter fusiformis]|uniref:DUF2062 domain-containing protein n=1 Tax=Prosthecobacter fusiformis TaxID=48464 RepID=A0A4R7RTM5_9BACT|nr:DUF2062 domain-containing protein [Prosthecobacter fusiformis]TDU68135.1 hypothetical protein EI77_03252 [Prosthecobacter fusiformis]
MVDFAKGYFRRSVFKTYRFFKHPRKLKTRPVMRWFARHFLDKRVWRPTQHTFAGGMAVGTFVTLQLLPIQMPSAVILAAVFRVNIPIAIAMCWVSNPVTMAALIPLEYNVGKWALAFLTEVPSTPFPTKFPEHVAEMWLALREHAPVMLFGGVILGAVLVPVSYVLTYLIWGAIDQWNKYRKQPTLPLKDLNS